MSVDEDRAGLDAITEKIIGCAHQVSNTLGSGFLEKVYENALAIELRKSGLQVQQQQPIQVFYHKQLVGEFAADLLIESAVIVELKSVRNLDEAHTAQCLNYLKATGHKVCLLMNFGQLRVTIKRVVHGF